MKSQESMTQAFNYEFLQPLITDGIMYSQIDCVSDKIRIPLGSLNANAKIPINGKLKMFRDLTEDELMQVYYDQHRCYYKAIEAKLNGSIFGKIKDVQDLDYVTGWYYKAAEQGHTLFREGGRQRRKLQ